MFQPISSKRLTSRSPASGNPDAIHRHGTLQTNPRIGIVCATGAVGAEAALCLEQRAFPLSGLRLFASGRSAGRTLRFRARAIAVEESTGAALDGIDIALFSTGGATLRHFAPMTAVHGVVVADNSSAFRIRPDVPLIVPERMPPPSPGTMASSPIRTAWRLSPRWQNGRCTVIAASAE